MVCTRAQGCGDDLGHSGSVPVSGARPGVPHAPRLHPEMIRHPGIKSDPVKIMCLNADSTSSLEREIFTTYNNCMNFHPDGSIKRFF